MDKNTAIGILRANRDAYYDASDDVNEALDVIFGEEEDPADVLLGWSLFYEGMDNEYEACLSMPGVDPDDIDEHLRVVLLYCADDTDDNEAFMQELFCSTELRCAPQMEFVFEFWENKPPYLGMDDDEIKAFIAEVAARYNTKITWGEDFDPEEIW